MIIGIAGKRGCGKTLAQSHVVKNHKFIPVSFAKPLKEHIKRLLPFTENDLTVPSKKEKPWQGHDWSPREFMIHFGEFMRFHEPNYWVSQGIASCVDNTKINYVFDDVRYKNEADAIKELGGTILRIERYEKFNPYGKDLDTPSETNLDDYTFDYIVEKMWNVAKEDLFRQVDAFISQKCQVKAEAPIVKEA